MRVDTRECWYTGHLSLAAGAIFLASLVVTAQAGEATNPPAIEVQIAAAKEERAKEREPAQPIRTAKPSKKLDPIMEHLAQASSLESVRKKIEQARLSPPELKALEAKLQSPEHEAKLRSLIEDAAQSSDGQERAARIAIDNKIKRRYAARQKSHASAISASEKSARRMHASHRAREGVTRKKGGRASSHVPRTNPAPSMRRQAQVQAQAQARSGGTPAQITVMTPSPAVVGGQVVVRGQGFGAAEGRVAFLLDEELVYGRVDSWSATEVRASLLDDRLADWVGEREKEATLWVKLAGGETGPLQTIGIAPNADQMVPTITALSSNSIAPTEFLAIVGTNFLNERRGTATITAKEIDRLTDRTMTMRIEEWSDTSVVAKMPFEQTWGLVGQPVFLTLTNHLGQDVRYPLEFQPRTIEKIVHFRPVWVHCEAWSTRRDAPGPLCVVGYQENQTYGLGLFNDWVVNDYFVEPLRGWGSKGYAWVDEPNIGHDGINYDIKVWADLYSWIKIQVVVSIEGPIDVDHGLSPHVWDIYPDSPQYQNE